MRFGSNDQVELRPVGGGTGCLLLLSVVASVVLTILVNVLIRL